MAKSKKGAVVAPSLKYDAPGAIRGGTVKVPSQSGSKVKSGRSGSKKKGSTTGGTLNMVGGVKSGIMKPPQ